jgi:hypothetical protein
MEMMKMTKKEAGSVLDDMIVKKEETAIDDMPLTSLREYRLYNEAARRENKKLKLNRYKIKPCPEELHPKQRVVFNRNDQPTNPCPVYVSNDLIHYEKKLIPGQTYDLPQCIISYLSEKGSPVWGWVDLPNGERETRMVSKTPRFALRTIYEEV